MEEEKKNTNENAEGTSPAEGAKTEQNVPYERFQEVIKKKNALEAELAKIAKEKDDRENQTLAEQKKFEDLYKKTADQLEQIKKDMEEEQLKNALITEGTKYGIIDLDAAYKLIDRSKLNIVDGKVTNIKEVIEALIKEKPYLVSKTTTYPLSGVPPQGEELTPEAISKMTMEQYANWRKTHGGK
ncbi:MAG: hypothetical protein GX452_04410 [Ignavibacteriales bacterium]|nr:hypothetical protein [Ignavibacteriales bacterium]